MSIIQDKLNELRYIKRTNLHEEAKVVGNYYRDIIRSYGIDCNYYKLKSNYPTEFITDLDYPAKFVLELSDKIGKENFQDHNLQMHAYGIEPDPDFSISAQMITYMEVESDIFNLNKYGIIPNTDVNFYFDSVDFATAFSPKTGRTREYKFKPRILSVESNYADFLKLGTYKKSDDDKYMLSTEFYFPLMFYSEELAAPISVNVPLGQFPLTADPDNPYILHGKYCEISGETSAKIIFPANELLYKSFNYEISGPIDVKNIALFAEVKLMIDGRYQNLTNLCGLVNTMVSTDVITTPEEISSTNDILQATVNHYEESHGIFYDDFFTIYDIVEFYKGLRDFTMIIKLWGSILFTDLNLMSKYKEKIVPMVGDIVTIDFPDERNRERYQITECNDKDLSQSGLNPLLHKYIWKCKAKRYVNDHEVFPEHNDADEQMAEKADLINTAAHNMAEEVDIYPENEDKIYGGYTKEDKFKDINKTEISTEDSGETTLIKFGNKSSIRTDGYDLFFYPIKGDKKKINPTNNDKEDAENKKWDKNIQFIKASDKQLVFIDIEGNHSVLVSVKNPNESEKTLSLVSMTELTMPMNGAVNPNKKDDNFFKFSNSGTLLFSDGNNLFCYFPDPDGKHYIQTKLSEDKTENDVNNL